MNLAEAALLYMKIHGKAARLEEKANELRSAWKHIKAEDVLAELSRTRYYAIRLGSVEVNDDAIREALDGYEYICEQEDTNA